MPPCAPSIEEAGAALTPVPRAHFDSLRGERALKARLGVATLDGFGDFTKPELAALAGLFTYVEITQVGRAPLIRPPRKEEPGSLLIIDAATQRQSRAGPLQPGRPGRQPARCHRPHRDRGRRAGAWRAVSAAR